MSLNGFIAFSLCPIDKGEYFILPPPAIRRHDIFLPLEGGAVKMGVKRWNGGTMSKIYKALEKAEKERERGAMKETPLLVEVQEEEKKERQKSIPVFPVEAGGVSDQRLVTFSQRGSLAAEQFRKLRTYLLRHRSLEFTKTIMVTSATSSEGKSFVSANLAGGIATDLHAHALLVDCDLRNPTLSQWFGGQNGRKGLSEYLTGNVKIPELLIKTEVERLSVLCGGAIQDNPTELIGSNKMEALVHELKSRYPDRYVIFDATPLLATTEPEVLGKLVDGIILVVRAGVTPRETVKQAIANLEKEKILGVVFNVVEFKSSGLFSRYFGSGDYYYRYGYGKSGAKPQSRWGKRFRFTRKNG